MASNDADDSPHGSFHRWIKLPFRCVVFFGLEREVVEGNRAADDAVCLCECVRDHGGEI